MIETGITNTLAPTSNFGVVTPSLARLPRQTSHLTSFTHRGLRSTESTSESPYRNLQYDVKAVHGSEGTTHRISADRNDSCLEAFFA